MYYVKVLGNTSTVGDAFATPDMAYQHAKAESKKEPFVFFTITHAQVENRTASTSIRAFAFGGQLRDAKVCTECKGTGKVGVYGYKCMTCEGQGVVMGKEFPS